MSEFESLSAPEKVIVKRLSLDEPLVIVNAWLGFNKFNPIDEKGLELFKVKYNKLIKDLRGVNSGESIFTELIEMKDLLIKTTNVTDDPKAVAQLSNSINSISKTIDDFIEKKKAEKDDSVAGPDEFLGVLNFLRSEGFIDFSEEKYDELCKHLFEPVSGK